MARKEHAAKPRRSLLLQRGRWEKKAAKGVAYLAEHLDGLLAILNFPEGHHKRLRTTNMVERVNQELEREGRLVRTWPNATSRERGRNLLPQPLTAPAGSLRRAAGGRCLGRRCHRGGG